MKKYVCSSLIIFLFSIWHVSAQKNLISNGGFEDGLNSWGAGNAKVSTVIRKSGEASLALVAYVKGKWEGIDQKVKLPKNSKAILVSGFYKMDDVEQGANAWNTAVIILEFTDGDKTLGEGIPLVEKTGTEGWSAFKKNLRVPDLATGFRIMIALSEASGTFFVDDLNVKSISVEDLEKETPVSKAN
ncbi:hypothetical protein ASE74_04620 [Pedobacter sp. Leaf216]|uniref:hypothetical protein n=1 Tax=Pedobacter sp. Leaf216 TaxID=1735684 RepID=UPI0006FE33DC|nr:hypothetical protein [Pedobacter sp. Leaf216]KQM69299.1 hypothetical protein ASE74_04620 [Pedobacter sp. Leaf216]